MGRHHLEAAMEFSVAMRSQELTTAVSKAHDSEVFLILLMNDCWLIIIIIIIHGNLTFDSWRWSIGTFHDKIWQDGSMDYVLPGWWFNNHLAKYEFVNGKDDIPYTMENKNSCLKPPTSDANWNNRKVWMDMDGCIVYNLLHILHISYRMYQLYMIYYSIY